MLLHAFALLYIASGESTYSITYSINDVTCMDKRKTVLSWKLKDGLKERHYTRLAGRALNSIKIIYIQLSIFSLNNSGL